MVVAICVLIVWIIVILLRTRNNNIRELQHRYIRSCKGNQLSDEECDIEIEKMLNKYMR